MATPDPATTEWVPVWDLNQSNIVGPQGPQGIQGIQGPQGPAGTIPPIKWISVPFANLSFSTNTGVWTVIAANMAYFKYAKIDGVLFVKCAITGTSVINSGTELRVSLTGIPLTLVGNDSFGMNIFTQDGFGTQDIGQSILRVANNSLVLKTRTGAAWVASVSVTGVIANLVGELA